MIDLPVDPCGGEPGNRACADLGVPVGVCGIAAQPLPARRLIPDQRERPHHDVSTVALEHVERSLSYRDLAERRGMDVVVHHEVSRTELPQLHHQRPGLASARAHGLVELT